MKSLPDWTQKVRAWREKYEAMIAPEWRGSLEKQIIVFEFDPKMTATAGQYRGHLTHSIKLSPWMQEREAEETFAHEYAHFCAYLLYGEIEHGFFWRSFMTCFGHTAEVTHRFPLGTRCILVGIDAKLAEAEEKKEAEK